MKNTTVGADPAPFEAPSKSFDVAPCPVVPKDPTHAQERVVYLKHSSEIINGNVIPNLRVLLGLVLRTVDASVPNKEQNRALKETIHDQFDGIYFDILKRTWPDANYGSTGGHAIMPETNRAKAFDVGVISV